VWAAELRIESGVCAGLLGTVAAGTVAVAEVDGASSESPPPPQADRPATLTQRSKLRKRIAFFVVMTRPQRFVVAVRTA
jgi:hypothetical protein